MGKKFSISYNSPVVLTFSLICLGALVLGFVTGGYTNGLLFSVYRSSLADPLTYFRFVGHVFGHAGWDHFIGNMTLLLVVGPLLEEKYGSQNIAFVILATAVITGLVNFIFFPHTALLGASGVVFAFILLSSFTCMKDGKIPLTFILIVIIYIGGQVYQGIFVKDNVSNLTHIIGGGVGSGLGFAMSRNKMGSFSS
ncbi:MAG: rhomboid family intramembrane serine protease [Ruminococcus sp.]|nr:rhomboid family intramembrane serine protease [Ruminococcus sp.]